MEYERKRGTRISLCALAYAAEGGCFHLLSWESLQKNKNWQGSVLERVKFEITVHYPNGDTE